MVCIECLASVVLCVWTTDYLLCHLIKKTVIQSLANEGEAGVGGGVCSNLDPRNEDNLSRRTNGHFLVDNPRASSLQSASAVTDAKTFRMDTIEIVPYTEVQRI